MLAREIETSTCEALSPPVAYPMMKSQLRRLRTLLAVIELGGVQQAAKYLHLTSSSLTRGIRELEASFGRVLFERESRGMAPTRAGAILATRARNAFEQLELAAQEISRRQARHAPQAPHSFARRVTSRQLLALIAIADHCTERAAASALSLSQPAVTMALSDLEALVGDRLFVRSRRRMVPTDLGLVLVQRAKLAFAEIEHAFGDVIAEEEGPICGSLVVGVLPLSGVSLAPRAINTFMKKHPAMQVSVVDGTYQSLRAGLRSGDIDIIVGGLSEAEFESDILHERLFDDDLLVVARMGHKLAERRSVSLEDLCDADWILPRRNTPCRVRFDEMLSVAGLRLRSNPIETNSVTLVRGLLLQTDRLSIVSNHQLYSGDLTGALSIVPVKLKAPTVPVGIRTLARPSYSAATKALLAHFRQVGSELVDRMC